MRPRMPRMSSWMSSEAKPESVRWWTRCAVERGDETRRFMKEMATSEELTVRPGPRQKTTL